MATSKGKSRSALGNNPLAKGIFSKTLPNEETEKESSEELAETSVFQESIKLNQESILLDSEAEAETLDSQESIKLNQESRFLSEETTERVNLRLSLDINDWLNDLLKHGKRKHGRKIPKEIWVQAALELFRALPVDWEAINSEEELRQMLINLESRFNKFDFSSNR